MKNSLIARAFIPFTIAGTITLITPFTRDDAVAAGSSRTSQIVIPAQTAIPSNAKDSIGELLKTYGTAASVTLALFTYLVNESWKRRQYVEEKVKDFEEKIESINVRKILSTELQCVELFPFESEPKYRFVIVKDCLLAEALLECKCNKELEEQYKSIKKDEPLYKQDAAIKAAIRDAFNRFSDYLQQFEKMIESRVVSEKSLQNYLSPWFQIIDRVDEEAYVVCPISKRKYKPKEAVLEYLGLLEAIPERALSVVQKDVRSLVCRYRSLNSFMLRERQDNREIDDIEAELENRKDGCTRS